MESGTTVATTTAGKATAAPAHPLAAHAALLQAHAHAVTKVTPIVPPPAVHTSFVQNLQNWALNWEPVRSEEHTSELQSREDLVCRLLLEKKNVNTNQTHNKKKKEKNKAIKKSKHIR